MKTGTAALCATIFLVIVLAPSQASSQSVAKVPRIGYLGGGAASLWHAGFEEGLRDLGYQPGRNITVEYRWYEGGGLERAKELAHDIVRSKPDVIVTAGPQGALAAKAVVSSIPVVFVGTVDPVKAGLVTSLGRPGGNMTGLVFDPAPEFVGKTIQLFREVIPKVSRLAVLLNPDMPGLGPYRDAINKAARTLGMETKEFALRRDTDIDPAFSEIRRERSEAVFVVGDPVTVTHHKRIVQFAARERLPIASVLRQFADAGALISYGPSLRDHARRAAQYVDKILKGAKPADLPVEQPTKFELVINLKAANTLGLTIPRSLLLQADQLIE